MNTAETGKGFVNSKKFFCLYETNRISKGYLWCKKLLEQDLKQKPVFGLEHEVYAWMNM